MDPQWRNTSKPHAGDISGGAQKCIATLARDPLRGRNISESMHMLGQERENSGLGKNNKSLRRDGRQHGWFFLKAKQRARRGADGRQYHFQSAIGGLGEVPLTREHGAQFGQDLGGEERRPASKKRIGQSC